MAKESETGGRNRWPLRAAKAVARLFGTWYQAFVAHTIVSLLLLLPIPILIAVGLRIWKPQKVLVHSCPFESPRHRIGKSFADGRTMSYGRPAFGTTIQRIPRPEIGHLTSVEQSGFAASNDGFLNLWTTSTTALMRAWTDQHHTEQSMWFAEMAAASDTRPQRRPSLRRGRLQPAEAVSCGAGRRSWRYRASARWPRHRYVPACPIQP